METNTQTTLGSPLTFTPTYACPSGKCAKVFSTPQGATLHDIRAHRPKPKRKTTRWTPERRRKFKATMMAKKRGAVAPAWQKPHGVIFCPRCGCNIRNVAAAIAFGDSKQ